MNLGNGEPCGRKAEEKLRLLEAELLDFSTRNRLINFKFGKNAIKLISPDISELYDRIRAVDSEPLTFKRPVKMEGEPEISAFASAMERSGAPIDMSEGDIGCDLSFEESRKLLKGIRAKAKSALEESGSNILYLCLGFIEWTELSKGTVVRSPLVMVPVSLVHQKLNAPYSLVRRDEEETVVNPTLLCYLRQNNTDFPELDIENDSITDYLEKVAAAGKTTEGISWTLVPEASLALLSFKKIAMYNDIQKYREILCDNKIFKILSEELPGVIEDGDKIKSTVLDSIPSRELYHVLDADASQMVAIMCAKAGISFVLNGPPGTGKSQTIANIIAQAIADGKKVLFVSEKMAALEVVHKRLCEAGLSDFALELYNTAKSKADILSDIYRNLALADIGAVGGDNTDLEALDSLREKLGNYLYELHKKSSALDTSLFRMFGVCEENNCGELIRYTPTSAFLDVTHSEYRDMLSLAERYAAAISDMGCAPTENPWRILGEDCSMGSAQQIKSDIVRLKGLITECRRALSAIPGCDITDSMVSFSQLELLGELLSEISELPSIPENWVTSFDAERLHSIILEAKSAREAKKLLDRSIFGIFNDDFESDGRTIVEKLATKNHAFRELGISKEDVMESLADISATLAVLSEMEKGLVGYDKIIKHVNEILGTDFKVSSEDARRAISVIDLAGTLKIPVEWFSEIPGNTRMFIERVRPSAKRLSEILEITEKTWRREVFTECGKYSVEEIRAAYERTRGLSIDKKIIDENYRAISGVFRNNLKDGRAPSYDEVMELCNYIDDYRKSFESFEIYSEYLKLSLGTLWNDHNTDWEFILNSMDTVQRLKNDFGGKIPEAVVRILSQDDRGVVGDLRIKRIELEEMLQAIEKKAQSDSTENSPIISSRLPLDKAIACGREALLEIKEVIDLASPYLRNPLESAKSVYEALCAICEREETENKLRNLDALVQRVFDGLPTVSDAYEPDLDLLDSYVTAFTSIRSMPLFEKLEMLPCGDANVKQATADAAETITRLADTVFSFKANIGKLCEALSADDSLVRALCGGSIGEMGNAIESYSECLGGINGHISRLAVLEECDKAGLGDFIERLEEKRIRSNITETFKRSFAQGWIEATLPDSPAVRTFTRQGHESMIEEFKRLDRKRHLFAAETVRRKAISRIGGGALTGNDAETKLLRRANESKGKGISLRSLFARIPNCLLKLKPCLMMSPLSVANLLDADKYHFDLVIFDEASQVYPGDAVGSILRGDQVIIAGDSRQMPPTSFFASTASKDDEDQYTDLDSVGAESSILDEFILNFPNIPLNIHYRSASEALIDFSNESFYDGSLVTFPACSDSEGMGISLEYVPEGRYIRNSNVAEAKRCVELLERHIKEHPERSLGIIAFSVAQQDVIENEISRWREEHPECEEFFERHEATMNPFFVRNLENVQGDERDSVIFSICYAKNEEGKFIMNFGPLTKSGGERRLNVAITRARQSVIVVSSVLPSDFNITDTSSRGNRILYEYIKYASNNGRMELSERNSKCAPIREDFREVIAKYIRGLGYNVVMTVGRSASYKIDIAIEHPEKKGTYIAAIECDGVYYTTAGNAKDRIITRPTMLSRMGWSVYRVWASAWNANNELEKAALREFLENAARNAGFTATETSDSVNELIAGSDEMSVTGIDGSAFVNQIVRRSTDADEEPTINSIDDVKKAAQSVAYGNDNAVKGSGNSFSANTGSIAVSDEEKETIISAPQKDYTKYNPYSFMEYIVTFFDRKIRSDAFENEATVLSRIYEIVSYEQPIHPELVAARLKSGDLSPDTCGISADTVKDYIEDRLGEYIMIDSEGFVRSTYPCEYRPRVPKSADDIRAIKHISSEEIRAILKALAEKNLFADSRSLIGECAVLLGYARDNTELTEKISAALDSLIEYGILEKTQGGAISIPGKADGNADI